MDLLFFHPTKECLQFLYVTVIEVLQSVKDIDTVSFVPGTGKEFLRGYAEVFTDAQKFVHRGHCLADRNTAHIAAAFAKVKAHFVFGNVEAMAQLLRWGHLLGVWGWVAAGFFSGRWGW